MSKIESLKKSRSVLIQHMQQLLQLTNLRQNQLETESSKETKKDHVCYECNQEIINSQVNNKPELYNSKFVSDKTKITADVIPMNPRMARSCIDRECQTAVDAESPERCIVNKIGNGIPLARDVSSALSVPFSSNSDACKSSISSAANNQANMSALAMVAAMTAATVFRKALQQSSVQVTTTHSETPYKSDFDNFSHSGNNSSTLPLENAHWKDFEMLHSFKCNTEQQQYKTNPQLEEYNYFHGHAPLQETTDVMYRSNVSPPPPPAPNSNFDNSGEINLPMSNCYSDIPHRLTSSLLLPDNLVEKHFPGPLESAFPQEFGREFESPQCISSNTDSQYQEPSYLDRKIADLSVSRERFSDRILRARKAIDLWECQQSHKLNEASGQIPIPGSEQNKHVKSENGSFIDKMIYPRQKSSITDSNFCAKCNNFKTQPPTAVLTCPIDQRECCTQKAVTPLTNYLFPHNRNSTGSISKIHPSASKTMPVQIVKPAVRNQNINIPDQVKNNEESTLNPEKQVMNHQTHLIKQPTEQQKPKCDIYGTKFRTMIDDRLKAYWSVRVQKMKGLVEQAEIQALKEAWLGLTR
ncbi:unnamed protein product [Heterobilharzia americana]|nr:unnamed protein product [Heterobilharzia americana]